MVCFLLKQRLAEDSIELRYRLAAFAAMIAANILSPVS